MKVLFKDFKPEAFSFEKDPLLVLEEFWTIEDQVFFQKAMKQASWKSLDKMPKTSNSFPNCGKWKKGDIGETEKQRFLEKINLSCVADYMGSSPDKKQSELNLNYFSFGVGDCLSIHNDADATSNEPSNNRQLAIVAYFHDKWDVDWGGELIVYDAVKADPNKQALVEISECVAPNPRSLVIFTIPRFHRVCRVDPRADEGYRQLSIETWFMTGDE